MIKQKTTKALSPKKLSPLKPDHSKEAVDREVARILAHLDNLKGKIAATCRARAEEEQAINAAIRFLDCGTPQSTITLIALLKSAIADEIVAGYEAASKKEK